MVGRSKGASCLPAGPKELILAVVAGIDEAGYGPVLGPMVVSAVAFSLPDELAGVSMWRLLAGVVSRKPGKRHGRVAINDSKKLYSGLRGKEGLVNLERGVLAMMAAQQGPPRSLEELLDRICPQAVEQLARYPWYAGADMPLPGCLSETDVKLSANAISAEMKRIPMDLRLVRAEPIFTGEYNHILQATRNKSSVLFDVTCRLLMHLWQHASDGMLRIVIDRQGGRMRYLPGLQRAFDGCQFKVMDESEALSAYRITDGPRSAELYFLINAEQRHLPAALASMVSKYLRELFMLLFNRFWANQMPDISPTAGYYSDGNRFYREIQPVMRQLGLDAQLVYRRR